MTRITSLLVCDRDKLELINFVPLALHTLHDALPLFLVVAEFHSKLDTICGKYALCVLVGMGALIVWLSSCFGLAQHTVLHLMAAGPQPPG